MNLRQFEWIHFIGELQFRFWATEIWGMVPYATVTFGSQPPKNSQGTKFHKLSHAQGNPGHVMNFHILQ